MAPCVITLCSDWPLRLLRFRVHNAQSKCAPVVFKQTICFVHFRYGSGIKKNSKLFAKPSRFDLFFKPKAGKRMKTRIR